MRLARRQDVLGASRQVGAVFLRQHGDGKGVPAEGVGVAEIGPYRLRPSTTDELAAKIVDRIGKAVD